MGCLLENRRLFQKKLCIASHISSLKISDWAKYKTESFYLRNGQKAQIHFYKNELNGTINYNIDYKVKTIIE